jgi:cell division protein FtsI/penicillin-binding protein 2
VISWFRLPSLLLVVAGMAFAQAPVTSQSARLADKFSPGVRKFAVPLQRTATRALAGRQGSVIVLDAGTGALLALAEHKPGSMPLAAPGSTVKPFVLRELLRLNRLRADEPIACRRIVRIGGRNFDCVHAPTPEPMMATTALAYSCNSYFSDVATRLSPAELEYALRHSGLVDQYRYSDFDTRGRLQRATTPDQLRLQGLGEFGIEVTPWSLASAYQRLAADVANGTAQAAVREGLLAATDYGMARLARPAGLTVAGKTGTSRASDGRWTHGWFAGYAPAEHPTAVIVVYLERGRGRDAAEIAAAALAPLVAGTKR